MRRRKNIKKIQAMIVILLICFISIAYAYLSSNIQINGTAVIKNKKWDIYFDNVEIYQGSVEPVVEPTTDAQNPLTIEYEVNLNKPGEYHKFDVDVVNNGEFDATLDSFTITKLTAEQQKYLDYSVTYKDGTEIAKGDIVNSKSSRKLTVNLEYKKDITVEDLQTEDQTLNLSIELIYVLAETESDEPVEDESTLVSDSLILGRTWGSRPGDVVELSTHNQRVTVATPILLNKGDSITVTQNTSYEFGYFLLQYNETDHKYHYTTDPGWQTALSTGDVTITATEECYLVTNWRSTKTNKVLTVDDLEAIKPLITLNRASTEEDPGNTDEPETDYSTVQYLLSQEVTVDTYTGCKIVTIPATLSDGTKIEPKVTLTASSVGGSDMKSALEYATNNKMAVVMNAGLFNTSTKVPQGQTIINGTSITNSPMTDDMGTAISDEESYPLCIGSSGELSAPYARSVDTSTMIADGVKYAVTGWCTLIENGAAKYSDFNTVEIVHKNSYSRQVIGQYEDGDYFILTTTSSDKSGMTYAAINEILLSLSKKVKFAYSLDGGGSAETVVDRTQINTIYEGTYGRKVPTLIYFDQR